EVADRAVFVWPAAGLVPVLAFFAAPAHAGDGIGAAGADPCGCRREEPRTHRHAEAAVAVQEGGARAAPIRVVRGEQEQRDLGAVTGAITNVAAVNFRHVSG